MAYFDTGILKSGESWIYLAVWRTRLAVRFAIINSWSGRRTFVCPSHAIFRRFFASAHGEARNTRADHAPKALLFFLSARSSTPGHLFMHSLLVDFARDCFAHRPIDWLACVFICFDELLRIPSSVLWIVSSIFGRAPSPHLAVSVSDIRRRREGSKK